MGTVTIVADIVISIGVGILAGFLTIYTFNRIPPKWLCDYDEEPSHEMWGPRIAKKPWTLVFSLTFIACALKLLNQGPLYALPGFLAIWVLLQIGMSDKKFMIIPDQFVIALAVIGFGFIPFRQSFQSQFLGALIGGGSILLIGIAGQLLIRKEAMGFGDVKLFSAVGLLSGVEGVMLIFLITVFASAIFFSIGMLLGRIKSGEQQPLGPFIAAGTAFFILFQQELFQLVDLYVSLF